MLILDGITLAAQTPARCARVMMDRRARNSGIASSRVYSSLTHGHITATHRGAPSFFLAWSGQTFARLDFPNAPPDLETAVRIAGRSSFKQLHQ